MKFVFYLLFIFMLLSVRCYAQDNNEKSKPAKKEKTPKAKKEKKLPENIETFPKNYLVRPRFVYPEISLGVNSRLFGKGEKFKYKPAVSGVVGLSFKIKKVYVSAAIQLPPTATLKKYYGTTKYRNININIQGRVLNWGIFYRDYKGFYLKTYEPYYPNWNKDSLGFPKSPSLRIIDAGLNLGFNFNHNFSMNASFAQGERQKKSAGSFLLGFSERYQRIETDTSFVPPTQGYLYPNLDKLQHGGFVSSILFLGFGYQFVIKKYFHFTTVALAGSGIQFQNYYQGKNRRFWINYPVYAAFKSQFGYNGEHFFANLIYTTELNTVPIKESRLTLINNWIEIGLGVRF